MEQLPPQPEALSEQELERLAELRSTYRGFLANMTFKSQQDELVWLDGLEHSIPEDLPPAS